MDCHSRKSVLQCCVEHMLILTCETQFECMNPGGVK